MNHTDAKEHIPFGKMLFRAITIYLFVCISLFLYFFFRWNSHYLVFFWIMFFFAVFFTIILMLTYTFQSHTRKNVRLFDWAELITGIILFIIAAIQIFMGEGDFVSYSFLIIGIFSFVYYSFRLLKIRSVNNIR